MKLSPSLLSSDFSQLGAVLKIIRDAGADYAHLDVMDGHFVPNITMGPPVIKSLRKSSDIIFDVHLMISEPERYVEAFADAGADIICFHLEASADPAGLIRRIKDLGKKCAAALKPGTPAGNLLPYLKDLDMALIMSVEPGFGGQAFMPAALDKARLIREYITINNYDCDVEMDGGIGINNLEAVISSGVNVVVAGTDIFAAPSIEARIKEYINRFKSGGKSP